jgi:hypothetical protein
VTRNLWLHCGSYKSGSSRLQNIAWTRREELLASGWLYPSTGLVTGEPEVGIRHSRLVYQHDKDPDVWRSLVDKLVAEIDGSPATHVLMSSETWSRPGRGEALADLLVALRSAGVVGEVHAVLYLRQRFDYARSLYREYTRRHSNVLPLAEYVEARERPLDLLDAVRTVRGAVAPGDLQVFPYNEIPDTAAHFFGLLGVEVPPETTRENLGIDAVEVEAHRQLNVLAPEMRPEWPGLAAAVPDDLVLPLEGWTEKFAKGQLEADEEWRAAFAAETGWPASTVDRLVERPADTGRDVNELAGILRGIVQSWLDSACEPVLEMQMYPHPLVEDLVVDRPEVSGSQFRLSGLLLTRVEGRLLAALGTEELEANHGRPSPGFARRHPGRSEAATARFAVPRCSFGNQSRIDLVFEHPSGERSLLATIWRRWRLR